MHSFETVRELPPNRTLRPQDPESFTRPLDYSAYNDSFLKILTFQFSLETEIDQTVWKIVKVTGIPIVSWCPELLW